MALWCMIPRKKVRILAPYPVFMPIAASSGSLSAPDRYTVRSLSYSPAAPRRRRMLDNVTYLDALHRDAAALAVAARRGLQAPVPSCPGWTVATLLTHLTGLYAYSVKLIEGRPREADALVTRYEDLDLPLEIKDLFGEEKESPSATPPGLLPLFEATAATSGSMGSACPWASWASQRWIAVSCTMRR